jgi:asparagine synthase (glutamine-hydrolysing)
VSAIAGMIDWRGRPAGPVVRKAMAALALHGRDNEGFWDGGDVALGWRQTVLHAEDFADRQPVTGGGGFHLVFDGRLDNRADLTRLLAIHSERACNMPDSAYALAAFEKWGDDCLPYLLGDFAFAIWDSSTRELFLARDHFGRRPLVYHSTDRYFFFASMPSALFTHAEVPRQIDEESFIIDICLRSLPADHTHYREIARIPVAHSMRVARDRKSLHGYWRLEDAPAIHLSKDDDYVDAFRERFDEAVQCRLRTIHPIGSHLSSGWDSSSVTATAARLLAERNQRLTAFTHVPPEGWHPADKIPGQITDEGPLAALVAAKLPNVDHVLVRSSGKWDFEGIDHYATHFERPLRAIHSGGWRNDLHRNARARGIRVMLSGVEGNLTISYPGLDRLSKLLRSGQLLSFAREWDGLKAFGYSTRRLLRLAVGPSLPDALWDLVQRILGRPGARSLNFNFLNPVLVAEYGLDWLSEKDKWGLSNVHRAGRALMLHRSQVDHSTFSGAGLAAWDLELRDPTGDRRIVEFCFAIPDDQFLRNGQTRWLLRRAMKDVLPEELLNEPARGRQTADWNEGAAKAKNLLLEEIGKLERNPTVERLADLKHIRETVECSIEGTPLNPSLLNEIMLRNIALGRFVRQFQDRNESHQTHLTGR